jgi:DUF1365 family protein
VRQASCLYEGTIRHRRVEPRREFQHQIALFYVDLDELPELLGGRLVARRPGILRLRARDYLGRGVIPMRLAVRDEVQRALGVRPDGPIRLLTQLRSFGHCFNPVNFYYCLDGDGERLQAVLAEVTNTPWGERQVYVLGGGSRSPAVLQAEFAKALHVSPFMAMDHRYVVRAAEPGARLSVHIESRRAESVRFDATLALRRTELTRSSVARVTRRYPLASARVLALIYGHALGLKLAGARVHPHPSRHHLPPEAASMKGSIPPPRR